MSEAHLRNLLQAQISEKAFTDSWSGTAPSYTSFLDDAASRLARHVSGSLADFSVLIRADGNQRVRMDGSFATESQSLAFYAEMVWLPLSNTFRGNVSVSEAMPTPPKKTVGEFIEALDNIRDESEAIFVGQVFNAMEGLDENDAGIAKSYPAIFRLFERLPEEDFGNPGHLVHLILARRRHESLLAKSLRRVPSIPALELAYELATGLQTPSKRARWIKEIRRVAACADVSLMVRERARGLLQ